MTERDQLVRLLASRSARRGRFTLASGRESTLYIDARQTTMTPEGQQLVGHLGLLALEEEHWAPDAVGGLTMGADPMAYAICHASAGGGRPIRAFTVRKEAKAHGTGRMVEGPVSAGDAVVVLEDVVTTGQSAARATSVLRELGAVPLGVLALVDRQEGGREHLESLGLRVRALTTAAEILPYIIT